MKKKRLVIFILLVLIITSHLGLSEEVDALFAAEENGAGSNTGDEVSGLPMYIFLGALLVLTGVIRYIYLKGKE